MSSSSLSHPLSPGLRRTSPIPASSVLAAGILLAACESSLPPTLCGALEDLTIHVHDDLFIEPCFEDPEMGAISLRVVSSAP